MHIAFISQVFVPVSHSSISVVKNKRYKKKTIDSLNNLGLHVKEALFFNNCRSFISSAKYTASKQVNLSLLETSVFVKVKWLESISSR